MRASPCQTPRLESWLLPGRLLRAGHPEAACAPTADPDHGRAEGSARLLLPWSPEQAQQRSTQHPGPRPQCFPHARQDLGRRGQPTETSWGRGCPRRATPATAEGQSPLPQGPLGASLETRSLGQGSDPVQQGLRTGAVQASGSHRTQAGSQGTAWPCSVGRAGTGAALPQGQDVPF